MVNYFFLIVFFLPQNETKTDIIKEGERYLHFKPGR